LAASISARKVIVSAIAVACTCAESAEVRPRLPVCAIWIG